MLISYMTKMMVMFSVIIVAGLFLTWVNDSLEQFFSRFRPAHKPTPQPKPFVIKPLTIAQPALSTPANLTEKLVVFKPTTETTPHGYADRHDYTGKIVKIDLAPKSRATQNETGEKLGEHVTVLPKAA
jgi:hypothetical protein